MLFRSVSSHDTHNVFPYSDSAPGSLTNASCSTCFRPPIITNARGWTQLLPYLDQAPLYNQVNHSMAAGTYVRTGALGTVVVPPSVAQEQIAGTVLTALLCPSDPGDRMYRGSTANYTISGTSAAAGRFGAKTSYEFNVFRYSDTEWGGASGWIGFSLVPSSPTSFNGRRPFGINSFARVRDFADGMSNVVGIAETTLDIRDGVTGTWFYTKWVGGGVDFAGATPINSWPCCSWAPPVTSVPGRLGTWGAPGSVHVGGMHVLLMDGAVRFVSENIDNTTRRNLGMMGDGTPIGEILS